MESQPQNAELDLNSSSDLFSVHLWAFNHLNLTLLTLCRHTQCSAKAAFLRHLTYKISKCPTLFEFSGTLSHEMWIGFSISSLFVP